MKLKFFKTILIFFIPLLIFPSCGTKRIVPITGRKIRIAEGSFSDRQMLEESKAAYPYIMSSYGKVSTNGQKTALVNRVANNLITATNNYLKTHGYSDELKYYEWEVHLIDSDVPNAFCMAGGKIVVLEGILPIAHDEAGLAAVLGHEIGHALAHHIAEEMTKEKKKKAIQTVGAVGIGIAGVATKADMNVVNQVISSGVDLSNTIMQYVERRYSRKHELEADRIGMVLMAMAGYDPREAPKIWERMTDLVGETPGTLLDTHPSNKQRKQEMEEKWMSEALSYYKNSGAAQKSYTSQTSSRSSAGSSASQSSATGTRYKVTATKLNVRVSPSTGASILGALSKGQVITVTSISGGWATITYQGKTGYVSSGYLIPE